jgi:hypothetical protein
MNRPLILIVGNVISTYSAPLIIIQFGPENLVIQPQILLLEKHSVRVCFCVHVAGTGEVESGGSERGAGGRRVLLKLFILNQQIQLTGCNTSNYKV